MHCKNCKFWERHRIFCSKNRLCSDNDERTVERYRYDEPYDVGLVYSEELPSEFGRCKNDRIIYDDISPENALLRANDSDCLIYCDSEGYNADFITGENFGCIHFLSKE